MAIKNSQKAFAGLNDTELSRQYFQPGEYVVRVVSLTHSEDNTGREFFGGDYEIVSSTNDTVKPGDVRSTFFTPNKFRSYFLRDIKALLSAICPDETDYEELVLKAVGEDQPLKGKVFVINTTEATDGKLNPKTNRPYARNQYISLEEAGISEADLPAAA